MEKVSTQAETAKERLDTLIEESDAHKAATRRQEEIDAEKAAEAASGLEKYSLKFVEAVLALPRLTDEKKAEFESARAGGWKFHPETTTSFVINKKPEPKGLVEKTRRMIEKRKKGWSEYETCQFSDEQLKSSRGFRELVAAAEKIGATVTIARDDKGKVEAVIDFRGAPKAEEADQAAA